MHILSASTNRSAAAINVISALECFAIELHPRQVRNQVLTEDKPKHSNFRFRQEECYGASDGERGRERKEGKLEKNFPQNFNIAYDCVQ